MQARAGSVNSATHPARRQRGCASRRRPGRFRHGRSELALDPAVKRDPLGGGAIANVARTGGPAAFVVEVLDSQGIAQIVVGILSAGGVVAFHHPVVGLVAVEGRGKAGLPAARGVVDAGMRMVERGDKSLIVQFVHLFIVDVGKFGFAGRGAGGVSGGEALLFRCCGIGGGALCVAAIESFSSARPRRVSVKCFSPTISPSRY